MVYESDFYTVRRPYTSRITPTISSYSVTSIPSQVTKYLPGVGKVYITNPYVHYNPYLRYNPYTAPYWPYHRIIRVRPSIYIRDFDPIENVYVVNTYQRHVPYYAQHALTYEPSQHVIRLRPSSYIRELDRIDNKLRTHSSHSYLSDYLNSRSAMTFEDEKRAIRAQSHALLQRCNAHVPRITVRVVPISSVTRYQSSPLPIRITSDAYINSLVSPVRRVADNILNISYYSEPAKRFLGPGHLACIRFAGDKAYTKRKHLSDITDHVIRNDINLLSYYLKNRQAAVTGGIPKPITVIGLSSVRPSRHFSTIKPLADPADEKREVEELKAAAKARALEEPQADSAASLRLKRRKQQEEKEAEERALAEEKAKQKEKAKKEEAARKAEQEKQAEIEKQRLLEEEAEREAQRIAKARKEAEEKQAAELAQQEEEAKRVAAEKKAAEETKAEEARLEAERKAEEEKQAELAKQEELKAAEKARQEELTRLEEIARQAEEEKEAELARQAEELAEIARQEAEIAKREQEEAELEKQAAAAELASPPAEADADAGNESVDEQADIPQEEAAEPVVEEPQTPEVADEPAVEESAAEEVAEEETE